MMFWFLYNVLFVAVMLLLLPKYLWRMWKRGGYRNGFMQRFGCYGQATVARPQGASSRFWIHAVSVGEMFIALRMRDALRRSCPEREIVLTTNTSTGHALAAQRLAPGDTLLYFPLDLPWIMRRAFDRINPGMLMLMECELWPNMLREAGRRGIPVVVANARLSDRSFAGYRRARWLFKRVAASLSAVYTQTRRDAERFAILGVNKESIHVVGNAKYDLAGADPDSPRLAAEALAQAGLGPAQYVILGGSTWPGEETCLMDMLARVRQAVVEPISLVLAPRHVERRAEILGCARRRGLDIVTRRETRERACIPDRTPDILLVDTTGELQHLYAAATVIFVGKSLTASGGQNPIEPAACGGAVVVGPHMENFSDVVEGLLAADAIVQVADAAELECEMVSLLRDLPRRESLGRQAKDAVQGFRGAIRRTIERLPPPRKNSDV